jgi:competence protein ComEA
MCHLAFASPVVDINAASAQEIAQGLVGIGLKKAEAIVAYRDQVGQILTIEELLVVKGIGEKTLARNRDRIRTVLMDGDAVRTRDPSDLERVHGANPLSP